VLWRARNGRAWTKSSNYPGARSTPTIDGNRVYHQSPLGNIVCLEAKTGDIVWEVDILNKVGSKNSTWALAESLLIDGDHVISCPGGPETCMVALDKNTGSIVWKAPSTGELAGYSSPILARHEGLRIIMTLTAKAIIGVNADNGKLLWHVKHESYADENVMIPIFHDGYVFISTLATGSVKWKLNVEDGKASLEEVWRTKEMDNHHGGVVLHEGYLYGSGHNARGWFCLDFMTGKQAWKASGKGSLTYADGMLYCMEERGTMNLIEATPKERRVAGSFALPKGGDGLCWAHPVVSGGRLYVRHDDKLFAYDIAEQANISFKKINKAARALIQTGLLKMKKY